MLVHLDRRLGLIGLARLRHELEDILGAPTELRAAVERMLSAGPARSQD